MKKVMVTTALALTAGLLNPTNAVAQAASDSSELDTLLNQIPGPESGSPKDAAPTSETAPAPQSNESPQVQSSTQPQPESNAPVAAPAEAAAAPQANAAVAKSPEGLDTIPVPLQKQAPSTQAKLGPKQSNGIEEIIVSARRISENMQDVPVAISALSGEDMRRDQINSATALQGRVPSLVIGTNSQMRNTETLTIRGQGAQFGTAPGVIIYYGEAALPADSVTNNQGGPGKFFDISNIQVLKGSQGTLFGRNTTGGALLIEPTKPQNDLLVSLRETTSSYSGRTYEGTLNVPIVDESLLLRVGGQLVKRDGFTKDVITGKDYDNKNYWTSRIGLTWHPTDKFENYLMGYYTRSRDNGTANVIEDINRVGLNQAIPGAVGLGVISQIPGVDLAQPANIGCVLVDTFGPSSNCGQDIIDEQHSRGHRRVQLSADPTDNMSTGGIVNNTSYALTDEMTLRNIASYSRFSHQYRWDQDGSRASFDDFNNPDGVNNTNLDTITEELQLQGTALDDKLKYAVGGYYEKTNAAGIIHATALFFENIVQQYSGEDKQSYAAFFQGTYDLGGVSDSLSGLSVTAGVRYTKDKTSGTATLLETALQVYDTVNKSHFSEVSSGAPTYTIGLDYKFENALVYGKVSRGYKTGGISVVAVNPDHYTYQPEFVTNYELGQKLDFEVADMPGRVNTAVYYTSYTNLQKTGIDSYVPPNMVTIIPQLGASVYNVGKATVAGFEFDGTLQPFKGVTLVATYGYTYAAYNKFSLIYGGATPQLDCTGQMIQRGSVVEMSCEPFQAVPKNQYSLSARYTLPIDASKGEVEVSTTYTWIDRAYSGQTTLEAQEPGAWLPSYGLYNASASWKNIMGSNFDAQLYGSNLANKEYIISNSNQWNLTYFRSSIYSEPRMIGLQIGYRWGS